MNYIKMVANALHTFSIQTSPPILSILNNSPSTPSPDASLTFNGTLLAAIIGALATIAVGLFGLFQFFKSRASDRENQRIQKEKEDMQRRLDNVAQIQQFDNEIEKIQYEDVLAARRETLERERQRKANTQAAARVVMSQARTASERTEAYRRALHSDTNISYLQILDMAYPMDVRKVYVRLRLHQDTRLRYDIDEALLAAEQQGDPNSLIKARYDLLETRSQAAMTPEEALQKYPRCIILGDPGAGKSTLLKYLALQSIDQQLPHLPALPVHIVLGDFASSPHQDLLRFAAERWDERYGFPEDEAQQYIKYHLSNGSAILLLDALDETVIGSNDQIARDSYAHVLAAINRVAVRYSKAPIVVTARKAGYYQRAHLIGFTELEVLDFRSQEITEFVTNWFKYHPTPSRYVTANELNTQLTRNPRIQSLASNPLLLSLIILVYELRQELPERRAEIYRQCIDVLLFRWDTSRDIRRRRRFKAEQKQDLLTEIAWYFHTRGRRYFPENELLRVIAQFLPTIDLLPEDSRSILHEIEEENGLLKEQAHGWHGFLHLTLQEYFVAQYLSNVEHGLSELLKHCGDPWWEEVMLLYVGSISDATPFLQALLHMERRYKLWNDIFHPSLLWAGQCLGTKPRRVQRELRNEIIDRLFRVLRKTPYSFMREQVTKTLLHIDSNDARGKLLIVLKDEQENDDIRKYIIGALGDIGDQAVVPDLLALLKNKQERSDIRKDIARALGELGDQSVVPDLLSILKDKQGQIGVREYIAGALGELGDQAVVPDLLSILKDKQERSDVRKDIAGALGELGHQVVVPDLLSILKDKQDEIYVRWNIAAALGELGDQAVVPDLLSILKDRQEESSVRWYVAGALGELGDQVVVPDLLSILKDRQEDRYVRRYVAGALGELGDQVVVPDLLSILKDRQEESSVRWYVAGALGELGDQVVVPDLLSILKDRQEESSVRWHIAGVLGKLGGREVAPDLLALLKDRQEKRAVRMQVAKILLKMGQQESIFAYLSLIKRNYKTKGIASEFMWNYASIRVFAQLLRVASPYDVSFQRALWEAAQRERVRILLFGVWRIRLVRVVRQ